MDDQIKNCDVNNTLLSINTSSIKEEDDSVDDKVHVLETVLIKAELPSSEGQCNVINDNVKIEEGIRASDIKIEIDNGLLYCEHCQGYYKDYCIECGMLVHILNRNAVDTSDNRTQELPNDILEIQHLFGQFGILALKVIPEGVKFGPFTGLSRTGSAWKIKGGKFVVDKDRSKYLNWMQYINPARNTCEGNIIVFQCEDYIYYRSTRQIQPRDELLVYFGEEFEDSLNENVEVDFIPATEQISMDVFACTFCCLGFSSKSYLVKHKTICLGEAASKFSFEELVQCPICKILFSQKEYLEHHFVYCSERNVRKCSPSKLSNQMTTVNRRKTGRGPLYKCQQCKYGTNYKADLEKHINSQHYKMKKSKCGICYRQFKTKKYLRLHVQNTHIFVGGKEGPSHSRCDYVNTHIKTKQSNSKGQRKRFKCCLCSFRTNHKQSLTIHIKTKHLTEFDYKCDSCEFRTNHKNYLEVHIKDKHLKKFDYRCDSCKYKTNVKVNFKKHVKSIHLKEFDFKCDSCEFSTNSKYRLEKHIRTKHLKKFDYKCDLCKFRTNYKRTLKSHTNTQHLNEYHFKCDLCVFRTNSKLYFESHIKSIHLKEIDFKCDSCEFITNQKKCLEKHIKRKHLKEFDFKCDSCKFRTNVKSNFKKHIKTKHLKEFDFACDLCEHKTNNKRHLEVHIKTKHLKEFDFKCDSCGFKTNYKLVLKRHINAKHLK